MFSNSYLCITCSINPGLHVFQPWASFHMYWEILLFPDRGQIHTLLNQTPLPSISCRYTHSQGTWLTSQQVSHSLRRAAESLGWEPAVPTPWEARSLIYCYLFSFSTQPSLDSVTHQWSAVTSAQILFGVLLFKKITSQPWRLIWFLENTILIFFPFALLLIFAFIMDRQCKSDS